MTLLKHEALKDAIEADDLESRLVIMPLLDRDRQIGPASVDVRLGTDFCLLRRTEGPGIDPAEELDPLLTRSEERVSVPFGAPLWLHPGQFVLGATLEFLRFPSHLGGYLVGRSSWGRVGLLIATAIMVQPGFAGCLTLELVNHGESPIAIYAGCRIAQLAVHSLGGRTEHGYAGKYVGPTGPEISRLDKERKEIAELHEVARRLAGVAPSPLSLP
jgi:dCTP deaminase